MLIDHFGRSITYLRISVTDRCNLRCAYCLPASGVQWMSNDLLLTADEIVRVAETAAGLGITKIRLTGGEPLVRSDILDIVKRIAKIPQIKDLSMTSNAMLLEKMAKPLAEAGLNRVNISLDTLNAEKFNRVTRFGDFSRVWRGILAAEEAGLAPIKLNTVVVGGFNDDDIHDLASLTLEHPWHVRFIELMPVANEEDWGGGLPPVNERYVTTKTMFNHLLDLNLQPVELSGNNGPERGFQSPGAPGVVGFISPLSEQFCNKCNRLRLTADGRLRSCLLVDKEISIREVLRSGGDLSAILEKAVEEKPKGHELGIHNCPDARCMSQIGG